MTSLHFEIALIAIVASMTCALPGVFLVLRGVAMMSDAISHAILLGIISMFLLVRTLDSPFLLIGATAMGILTVFCTEMVIASKKLKQDAAIGFIFPLFFSLAVVLISCCARNIHLDMDMVLLGELAFAPFNRCFIAGVDCGPYALWAMFIPFLINSAVLAFWYKELILTTFDPTLAIMSGISPSFFYYMIMSLTSMTAVVAFDAIGSIMVVALMITPCASAYLVARRLKDMIFLSLIFALFSAVLGYLFAVWADVSIAGSIASMAGILFMGSFFIQNLIVSI
jgi:manganese/zinc/iron transport system permease protein